MLLYCDKISGDELFSDAFPVNEVDDVAYEVDCKMIVISDAEVDIGANPSAEGGDDEGADSTSQTVNNVVHTSRLTETAFDKKSYMTYIKGYMKALKAKLQETNPERVPIFEKNATVLIKKILGNFKEYEFYTGESMDPEGMVALLNYREDGVTPYFTFFKDGVSEQKL
ncbi:translationally-controlled tumor protein [Backusella circina FSU 941]|nr:translationally-controlled tumor protein [Backusella circina FSU 941]